MPESEGCNETKDGELQRVRELYHLLRPRADSVPPKDSNAWYAELGIFDTAFRSQIGLSTVSQFLKRTSRRPHYQQWSPCCNSRRYLSYTPQRTSNPSGPRSTDSDDAGYQLLDLY